MENMESVKVETLENMKLRVAKEKIHQTDSRKYKAMLHEKMTSLFETLDIDVTPIENALILEIPHDELGAVIVETKFIIKKTDYDIISANEQHLEKVEKEKNRKPVGV